MEPFPDHKKLCQCAHGVSIDVFMPFSVSDEEVRDGETSPKALIPVTPQIVLTTSASTDAVATLGNHKRQYLSPPDATQGKIPSRHANLQDSQKESWSFCIVLMKLQQ